MSPKHSLDDDDDDAYGDVPSVKHSMILNKIMIISMLTIFLSLSYSVYFCFVSLKLNNNNNIDEQTKSYRGLNQTKLIASNSLRLYSEKNENK